jgi:sugar/nucleoside kinase (ribokinase family)
MNHKYDVLGIGNAIVDVLSFSEDTFINEFGLRKGTMILIDEARAEELYQHMGPAQEVSGGSAANTLAAVASLGGTASFIGKVRDDELGHIFTHDMRATGVHFDTPHALSGKATARCLIFVTPDAQRTMNTYIGACTGLSEADIIEQQVRDSAITYVEGYMYCDQQTKTAIRKAVAIARAAGRQVAFTPSDVFCIENHHQDFIDLIRDCDLVFANEEEVKALYGVDGFDAAVDAIRGQCKTAVVTRGALGSVVVTADDAVAVGAAPVREVVDTTGAGDLFAAGYLHGYLKGWSAHDCAALGGKCAAEIIQYVGARTMKPLTRLLESAA